MEQAIGSPRTEAARGHVSSSTAVNGRLPKDHALGTSPASLWDRIGLPLLVMGDMLHHEQYQRCDEDFFDGAIAHRHSIRPCAFGDALGVLMWRS